MYKYLENIVDFSERDPTVKSDFKWDPEICEFYNTIEYLGDRKTLNFVRGPGHFGSGKGGIKKLDSFADFNLGGPSDNALRKYKSGYTTKTGVIKPYLQSFYSLAVQSENETSCSVDTDSLQIIPCSISSDGTALKPDLAYDNGQ